MEILITGWTWAIGLEKVLQDNVNLFYLLPPTKWGISLKFRNECKSLDLSDRFAFNQFNEKVSLNASSLLTGCHNHNWLGITKACISGRGTCNRNSGPTYGDHAAGHTMMWHTDGNTGNIYGYLYCRVFRLMEAVTKLIFWESDELDAPSLYSVTGLGTASGRELSRNRHSFSANDRI